ncbi:YjfB family protein [Alkalihalobacillus oceani]|uniref:YjfB family protein n=1 Tax=Halalkalibacter oceani TaxID=1653776 RepID=UPI0020401FC5|nr:YjfB family protein [Halalkalibacter oceani]MCM3760673.1 YjfB family protein [Halalkalibacter oceani]
MDIALLSMAMNQGQIRQEASMAVMKKAMGNAEQQGEALQKLLSSADVAAIQHAAQPHLGGSIDVTL